METPADQLKLRRVELLRLDEHVFAYPDLAEVVQQRSITQLLYLVAVEAGRIKARPGIAVHRERDIH